MNIKKPGHTWILNQWIIGQDISDGAFRTLALLRSYNYEIIKPSIPRLAARRGKSRSAICDHLRELKEKGYITTKRSGYSASNIYKFISPENSTNGSGGITEIDIPIGQETGHQSSNNPDHNNDFNNGLKSDPNVLRGKPLEQRMEQIRNELEFLRKNKKPP